jgi:O-antigen ligase
MIRLTLLSLFCAFLCVYAWRDWFKALCGLILMMAVIEHPDMPNSLLGIQGLNPWNICLLFIGAAWISARKREGLKWDMPGGTKLLLYLYLIFVLVGFLRLAIAPEKLAVWYQLHQNPVPGIGSLISEFLVNTIKWVFPGIMLYDGCRTRSRLNWAAAATLGVYVLLAVQVIRWMPLSAITDGDALTERSLKILSNEVGYHRVNLAVLLAGAVWAVFAAKSLAETKRMEWVTLGLCAVTLFGLALTGGRMGYATWAAVGLMMAMLRWRKYLIFGPVIAAIVISMVPAVQERFTQGFTAETRDTNTRLQQTRKIQGDEPDAYTITAGRNVAWPYVIKKIGEAPMLGHGREAMQTTGVASYLLSSFGEEFPHPHNAYLQITLDNGLLGAIPIVFFYLLLLKRSVSLFMDSRSPEFIAVGGMAFSLIAALMIGGMGSQSFYPREGAVGMWCAIGLMLRLHVERSRAVKAALADRAPVTRLGAMQKFLWSPSVAMRNR